MKKPSQLAYEREQMRARPAAVITELAALDYALTGIEPSYKPPGTVNCPAASGAVNGGREPRNSGGVTRFLPEGFRQTSRRKLVQRIECGRSPRVDKTYR
jgi:hypothetical protein